MNAYMQDHVAHTIAHVRDLQIGESSGHDWWHTHRVWRNAVFIGTREGADLGIVQLAALLHDIADWKLYGGDTQIGPQRAREFLVREGVTPTDIDHVCMIIATMSFKGHGVASVMPTLEGQVVQDADRLDAIGAIGIARAFAYGGHKGYEIYNPDVPIMTYQTAEQYLAARTPTINHFYEKLLLLRDLMNTATGRALADERQAFMELYLKTFFAELQIGGDQKGF